MNLRNKKQGHWRHASFFLMICILFLSPFYGVESFKADVSGLCPNNQTGTTCPGHEHNWETPSDCSTCDGDHIIDTSTDCSGCKGKGYRPNSLTSPGQEAIYYSSGSCGVSSCGGNGSTHYHLEIQGCATCGGSGKVYYYSTKKFTVSSFTSATKSSNNNYKRGSGVKTGTKDCSNCYASGAYKGQNTRCKNASWSGCGKGSYDAWDQSGICYTDTCTPVYDSHVMNGLLESDSTYHWQRCSYCDGTMGTASHNYGDEWTSGGYRYQTCATCNWQKNNGAISYTITYHGNNATGGTTASSNHTYDIGSYLTGNGFYRTGYTFQGWATSSDSTTVTFYNGQAVSNLTNIHNATVHLYAVWRPNSYTITFHSNGGINGPLSSISTTYDSSDYYSDERIVPSRIGYTFLGWYTSIENGTQVYNSQGICVNDAVFWNNNKWIYPNDVTLYAHWKKNTYTVTYNGNGGFVTLDTTNVFYADPVDLNNVKGTKQGYVFTGWNTSASAKEPLSSYTMPADNITLYAIYSIPISDVKGVYLIAWPDGNTNAFGSTKFIQTAVQDLRYTYSLSNANLSNLTGAASNQYAILSFDHAGNYSILEQTTTTPPPPNAFNYYVQTVNHYKYNILQNEWVCFDTTSELKLAGEKFTPTYLSTVPTGYFADHIDSSYVVYSDTTSSAYYTPLTYQITFDPNGGTVSPTSKNIVYQDFYGELPIPERSGYTFTGWHTAPDGGSHITSSTKYETSNDTTLYAHWEINNYTVIYDYWTNGGESASKETDFIPYSSNVDLVVKATKYGWSFIGWNTNPDETTPLASISIDDKNLILYAIYKKDITATFVDSYNQNIRTHSVTIYNRETECNMPIPYTIDIDGWNAIGWSMDHSADGNVHTSGGSDYILSDDATFYGCYTQDIHISYDTNGSADEISPQTLTRFFNAYGNYKNPSFTLAKAPSLSKHSFVQWEELHTDGTVITSYNAGQHISATNTMYLKAKWNAHPEIEAYDRYFTLLEAQNDEITTNRLLETVTATDKEDGILSNGTQVIIKDYHSENFTNLTANADLTITYQATDSFGNITEKRITIHIVDTTVTQSPIQYYSRFIHPDFFLLQNDFVPTSLGGLESTSIWRTNELYQQLLTNTLNSTSPTHTFSFSYDELSHMKSH